jgi:Tripartite tricarboxylate transporter TctB family
MKRQREFKKSRGAVLMQIRNKKDLWSGVLFVVTGVLFMILSRQYQMGTAAKMGPGYFPTMLGGLMALLGLITCWTSISKSAAKVELNKVGWRELALVLVAVVVFALLLPKMGIIVAIVGLIGVSAIASHEYNIKDTLITTVVLLILSYVVFVWGLELQFPVLPTFMTK